MAHIQNEISIVLGGSAGQGIQTIETLIMNVLRHEGYYVFATKEYMSRIRGGSNSTEIRVTLKKRYAFTDHIDLLFLLDESVLDHMKNRIGKNTLVLGDVHLFKKKFAHDVVNIPLRQWSTQLGNPVFANVIAVGAVLGLLKSDENFFFDLIAKMFAKKGDSIVAKNIEAAKIGYNFGRHMAFLQGVDIHIARQGAVRKELLLSGTEALGMGVLAGGCNFVSSYPMSPGTGLFTFLAQNGKKFGLAIEQVEDEISAINMSLGAWYAGARAIVTTSGGGFALMEEGVSLSGMLETPSVIHIAQRPGPATGLPTRTEQADLNLALYAGHGEFPRAIFSPGDFEELFEVAQQAFSLADTYQSPVFLLTDQYLLDSTGTLSEKRLKRLPIQNGFIKTKKDYRRYELSKTGISPRGIPGFGTGLVVVDSDEHTQDGHITEDFEVRVAMMEKRMKKLDGIRKNVLKPVIGGGKDGKFLVVGWGSTKGVIEEALEKSDRQDIATLHFKQVYPLPKNIATYFDGFKKVMVIENNFTGQFANLLKQEGIKVTENILKYNGEPFCVEELTEKFKKL